jgi:hypothetical protein
MSDAINAMIQSAIASLKKLELSELTSFGRDKLTIRHASGGTIQFRNDGKVYYNGTEIGGSGIGIVTGDLDMNSYNVDDIGGLYFDTAGITKIATDDVSENMVIQASENMYLNALGDTIYMEDNVNFGTNTISDISSISDCGSITLNTGATVTTHYLHLKSISGYYSRFQPQAQTSNLSYSLPLTMGTDGQVLALTGVSGDTASLEWADGGSGSGLTVCTSSTKPASPTEGMMIYVTDNTAGQEIETYDGSAWVTDGMGTMSNLVEDTTPQLGGDLEVNSHKITAASNGDIELQLQGTGVIKLTRSA